MPPPSGFPNDLDVSITANLSSALTSARIIEDLGNVPYPEGIKSPDVELNENAKDGKFRYDPDFLMQFMPICKEKPDMLLPMDVFGLDPSDEAFVKHRGGSVRRQPAPRQDLTSSTDNFGQLLSTSGFLRTGSFGVKITSEEQLAMATVGRPPSGSISSTMQQFSLSSPVASQGGADSSIGGGRGKNRDGPNAASPSYNERAGPTIAPGVIPLEHVVPLEPSINRWIPISIYPFSPEMAHRKIMGLLNKLTTQNFDSISDQIIAWINRSENERDGRTLRRVIRLVFEKAIDEAVWSEMYARLSRKMMEQISPKVQDDGVENSEGKPIAGGPLFRKYLLGHCQDAFEHGWVAKRVIAASTAAKAANEEIKEGGGDEEVVLYSDEYYAAQKAKRQGLGLVKFMGELFKSQMVAERIMHECVKKLLVNVEEAEIENLCELLLTVGFILDTSKARSYMDVYFSRMKELAKSQKVSLRMQFKLQDVIELRERKWVPRKIVEKAAQEEERNTYGNRLVDFTPADSDGWPITGSYHRNVPKAGDLSKFGKSMKRGR